MRIALAALLLACGCVSPARRASECAVKCAVKVLVKPGYSDADRADMVRSCNAFCQEFYNPKGAK